MTTAKIAIVAAYDPDGTQGGAAIMRDLLDELPASQLIWLCRRRSPKANWRSEVKRLAFPYRVRGRGLLGPGIGRRLAAMEGWAFGKWAAATANRVGAERLWVVLDHDNIHAASEAARAFRGPIHASVHDDPSSVWALVNDRDETADRRLDDIWPRVRSADAVSEKLAERLRERGIPRVCVATRGFRLERSISPDFHPHRVVMGGWIGPDPRAADSLVRAFHTIKSTLRDAELHLVDSRLRAHAGHGIHIHDWMAPDEYQTLLSSASIGFSYDAMSSGSEDFAATSFPTKIVTYIGSGKPFVYQGPIGGSVGKLVEQFRCGLIVDDELPSRLGEALLRALTVDRASLASESLRARQELFDITRIRDRVFQTIMS